MAYCIRGAAFAYSACTIVNHNTNLNQPCYAYSLMAASTIDVIVRSQRPSRCDEGTTTSSHHRSDDDSIGSLRISLQGLSFGEIEARLTVTWPISVYSSTSVLATTFTSCPVTFEFKQRHKHR